MAGGVSLPIPGVGQTIETAWFITLSFQAKLPVIFSGQILFEDIKSGIEVVVVVGVVDLIVGV